MAGSFLPIQLIYLGKTPLSQRKYKFSKGFHVTQTPNHWANEETGIAFLKHVLIPYIETQREELNSSGPWLLISDVFKGRWTDHVKEIVQRSNGKMVSVPNNWTSYYQPLDLTVNRSCKDFLRQEAQKWYSDKINKQTTREKRSNEVKVDVILSVIKPLHAKWIVKFYDWFSDVFRGYRKEISDCNGLNPSQK